MTRIRPNHTTTPTPSTDASERTTPTRPATTTPAATPSDGFSASTSSPSTRRTQPARASLTRDLGAASTSATETTVATARQRNTAVRHTTLRQGAKGAEVRTLQNALTQLGHSPGAADGDFGRKTKSALMSFQRAEGLQADGVAGPDTWRTIDNKLNPPTTTTPTTPGTDTTPTAPGTPGTDTATTTPDTDPTTTTPGTDTTPTTPTNPGTDTTTPGTDATTTPGTDHEHGVEGHDHDHTDPTIPPFQAPDAVLRPGAEGEDVKALQDRLTQLGYKPGEANGQYNDETKKALTQFQQMAQLKPDGVVGPKTWEALEKGEATAPEPLPPFEAPGGVLRKGAKNGDVTALQERLKQFGFDPGAADGHFGAGTDSAVRSFQLAAGLKGDGVVGAKTWEALEKGRDAIVNPVTIGDVPGLGPITSATGYVNGKPLQIQLAGVEGKQLEVDTAKAYLQMKAAAARDGVDIRLVSGFRSNEKQRQLYDGWRRRLPGFNPANRPGYSNHQSGVAIDVNALGPTRSRGSGAVYNWLARNAEQYGFKRIASERWHWEYQPGLAKYR